MAHLPTSPWRGSGAEGTGPNGLFSRPVLRVPDPPAGLSSLGLAASEESSERVRDPG